MCMGYSKTNERLAVQLREDLNEIREKNDKNVKWKLEEDVIELLEELSSVGYFYDEDSWNVYPNEDEYFDEAPLDLYSNDDFDEDGDEDYNGNRKYNVDDEDF